MSVFLLRRRTEVVDKVRFEDMNVVSVSSVMSVKVLLLIALSLQLSSSREARNKNRRHKFNNCRRPLTVEAISHPEGIAVKWVFKDGSSRESSRERLRITLINFKTKKGPTKEVDYAQEGTADFTHLPTQQGKYRARVNVYSCKKYRESGEVKWPLIQLKSEKKCTCGLPDVVIVTPGDGVTLSWSKCTGPGESTVAVIEDNGNGVRGEIFIVSDTVSAEQMQDMTNKTFPNFNPKSGRYMGVIGTELCGNKYRMSETFFWPDCRRPLTVKATSHREGITVKWEFKDGSSRERLNITLINCETKEEYPKEVDYAQEGTADFTHLPTQQGKYRARVNVYSCKKYRESGEVKWPLIQLKSEKNCTCGLPDAVIVTPGDGVTLSWSKCTGPGESTVAVIEDNGNGVRGAIFIVFETVSAEKMQDLTNKTFPNFNPKSGRYLGVIGAQLCGNKYRMSETFFWPVEKSQTIPEMKQAIVKKTESPALSNTNFTICIVSLVATIGVVAIGILVYTTFKKSKEPRDQEFGCLHPEMTFDHTRRKLKKKLCTVHSVTVLYPPEQEDLFNTAMRLTRQVLDQGRNAVPREITRDLDIVDVDIILYVTTEGDIELPELLKPLIDRIIVVAIMGKGQTTPSVYFPGNFIYNDDVDNVTTLDDLLQSLGDDRKKLFLLCNAEKENQRKRSTVIEILQEANFDVVDPDDRKHRDKQRENLYQWVSEKLEEAHYIIIVPEDDDHLNPCPSNLTRCAMTTLDLLDQRELSTRVLLVTFGKRNLDQFISKRPYLSVCYQFALWEGDGCPQVMLRPLLNHLGIEQDICFEDSDALL